MPMHDWTRMNAGDYHHFHQRWIQSIADALNGGMLPSEFMALSDQVTGRPVPDVVTLQTREPKGNPGGLAVKAAPPSARVVQRFEKIVYAQRADRVVIQHGRGKVVAIIELVAPGNKHSRHAIRSFVDKSLEILSQGINLLIVDPFPPTPRDPQGIHKLIADELGDEPFEFLSEKPLTVASYVGGDLPIAYVETIGVGDVLPSMPVFLTDVYNVPVPLEETYMQAWAVYPPFLKEVMAGTAAG